MRIKTITALAYKYRYVENYYLENGTDCKKQKVISKLNALRPTLGERQLFEDICDSMGV